jgi:hypothetical protein
VQNLVSDSCKALLSAKSSEAETPLMMFNQIGTLGPRDLNGLGSVCLERGLLSHDFEFPVTLLSELFGYCLDVF